MPGTLRFRTMPEEQLAGPGVHEGLLQTRVPF